ncbi:DNA-directed RNA polymerase subunit delta [Bacillus sp. SLBN-46]|uniref:DNA-directed RNA polymerase subunit delta n=1 Tax=Bacillus sp. SLBN-46 TaxID=3042283 RepID=UPI0028593EF7|nr:DNA-directed RNA polymerase subunit delta [Bacillus sp. SLBN-46]MDR6120959.1 DNA-directed RNA polymerase subunit delta [Bacillus sp. SLBN-46]
MSLAQYSKEELQELSLIEMAHEYLKNSKQPIAFNELINEITNAVGMSQEEIRSRLAQFYTDMNIDGRFLSLGENRWGLRVWYPVDTAEEEVVTVVKPKKKKAKKVVEEDEIEDFDEIDEEEYDELDDFADEDDLLDEDDDLDIDEDEDLDLDEDVIEEDEFELDEDEDLDEDLDEEEEVFEEEEDEDL